MALVTFTSVAKSILGSMPNISSLRTFKGCSGKCRQWIQDLMQIVGYASNDLTPRSCTRHFVMSSVFPLRQISWTLTPLESVPLMSTYTPVWSLCKKRRGTHCWISWGSALVHLVDEGLKSEDLVLKSKNLKSLRSSHQNNVQSSLGTPCARSFIKSCIWVFAQAWTSECPNDHQPFWKVLQKVVRSAQNAFNVSHCKQWRQGRQQEQQVGRKCLIQHIHNWSITPRVRRLPAIQLRPATVSCPPCLQLKTRRLRKFQALALPQLNVAGRGLIVFQQVPDITTLCNREVPCCTQPKKKAYSRIQLSV